MSIAPTSPSPQDGGALDPSDADPLSRRLLARGLVAGLAAAAVSPALTATEAEAVDARHRRRCRHWHRCAKHPKHTCRRKHRCKHLRHRAAPTQPGEPTGPTEPTGPGTPTGPPSDPDFVRSPVPTAASLHLANRFTYGMTPALHEEMRGAGGPARWFEQQLDPASIADPKADPMHTWWLSIDLDAPTIAQRNNDEVEGGWVAMANYARWCLLRRIYSQRQVLEVMTEFWENHLHVPLDDDGVFAYRADYGKLLRSHALGRFDQMLVAAITHPAMGTSLDNARSTKKAPNENLGRELLELHTVGRGNHGEDDVKTSSRILTGYRVDLWTTWRSYYDPASHWTGPVSVLGFEHPNANADGRAVTEAYLTHLARHPRTAERIARKLAVRFVSDDPPAALVERLARVYLDNETAIKPVLRALVASPEFLGAAGRKVRTPTDDVVATHRALSTEIARPVNADSAANSFLWHTSSIGHSPFAWARPDGPPDTGRAWSSASRLLASFDVHLTLSGGWWPTRQITYRTPASWMPADSVRFDQLVDHLCRQLLGKAAPARLVTACAQAVNVPESATITASHAVVRWQFPLVLTTLLDSPDHLHR
ncbi:DUF1800 domain-containing protein [Nocardioides sp. 1609]|uniref:DUF1800 domain-containing protein n=1 Tax=Nocardioides sp. 1609 TaxID=2508327 RepID=UPI0010703AB9|nr:DUF1800 domain-containing protein [Nocardioides sp. 1609]